MEYLIGKLLDYLIGGLIVANAVVIIKLVLKCKTKYMRIAILQFVAIMIVFVFPIVCFIWLLIVGLCWKIPVIGGFIAIPFCFFVGRFTHLKLKKLAEILIDKAGEKDLKYREQEISGVEVEQKVTAKEVKEKNIEVEVRPNLLTTVANFITTIIFLPFL